MSDFTYKEKGQDELIKVLPEGKIFIEGKETTDSLKIARALYTFGLSIKVDMDEKDRVLESTRKAIKHVLEKTSCVRCNICALHNQGYYDKCDFRQALKTIDKALGKEIKK